MEGDIHKAIHDYKAYLRRKMEEVENDDLVEGAYKDGQLKAYYSAYLWLIRDFPELEDDGKDCDQL